MDAHRVTVVVPCYNEKATLRESVGRVLSAFAQHENLKLELLIIDDCSTDRGDLDGVDLEREHEEVRLVRHTTNQGKGAALQTGFAAASGDYVAIHDADLEYDPRDLIMLLDPLLDGNADVVYGSRFLTHRPHRVLYFWHSLGNSFLTFLSNMFTDLNLSDMETCYKVFRRDVLEKIELTEKRFGIEPEMTAKVADLRVRVYEVGISYYGRTYEEGKKIGVRDGIRALYCIFKFNAHRLPLPLQFLAYVFIGGLAMLANLAAFGLFYQAGVSVPISAAVAFVIAAIINYLLCVALLFTHNARWSTPMELFTYVLVVGVVGTLDVFLTQFLITAGMGPLVAKAAASAFGLVFNFLGRRWLVFAVKPRGPWRRQE